MLQQSLSSRVTQRAAHKHARRGYYALKNVLRQSLSHWCSAIGAQQQLAGPQSPALRTALLTLPLQQQLQQQADWHTTYGTFGCHDCQRQLRLVLNSPSTLLGTT